MAGLSAFIHQNRLSAKRSLQLPFDTAPSQQNLNYFRLGDDPPGTRYDHSFFSATKTRGLSFFPKCIPNSAAILAGGHCGWQS